MGLEFEKVYCVVMVKIVNNMEGDLLWVYGVGKVYMLSFVNVI